MSDKKENTGSPTDSPLSLGQLRAAFAEMLGTEPDAEASPVDKATETKQAVVVGKDDQVALHDPCEINPRSVVEAMLFVGRPEGAALTARELAAAMRGVSPTEIDAAVNELNDTYQSEEAPYHITGSSCGYRLVLREEYDRMRDKFFGRLKESRLSPTALEVLSIVAYNQPTTASDVSELRGTASGTALASLVRRKLVRLDRPADRSEPPQYSTTDRFLRLFGLENVAALPRSEDLEKL